MIDKRSFESLGHADHGWLNARHHFSFANYYDPDRTGWGSIRVWNDDEIAAKGGFPMHPHRDMEIVTYVRRGAITHSDSMGNEGRTMAGDVQVMSAGTGVRHSEYNLEDEQTTLFQIWIEPNQAGGTPRWDAKEFPKNDAGGKFEILASGFDQDILDGALFIRTDARVMGATLKAGETIDYEVGEGRHGYLVPATGKVVANDVDLNARDGAAISGGTKLRLEALEDSELVFVDAA